MDITDATIVLTGATAGIGRAAALALAAQCGKLIIHGPQAEDDVGDLIDSAIATMRPGAELVYLSADYDELVNVAELAEKVRATTDHVDVLVNNAARPGPPSRTVSPDGNEVTWQTNYLAPVALTSALLDLMGNARPSRIVVVSSATHESATLQIGDVGLVRHGYSPVTAYAQSKLALVTYTCWLSAHLPTRPIEAVSIHPGVIATDLLHAMFAVGGDSPEHGAANIVRVVSLSGDNGAYYDERRRAAPNPEALDDATQRRLHDLTVAELARTLPASALP